MSDKPIGKFKCAGCSEVWDGSQLYQDQSTLGIRWTCGNLFCGATVYRLVETLNCPICGKEYSQTRPTRWGGMEYIHAGDPANVVCQQSSASYKASQQ